MFTVKWTKSGARLRLVPLPQYYTTTDETEDEGKAKTPFGSWNFLREKIIGTLDACKSTACFACQGQVPSGPLDGGGILALLYHNKNYYRWRTLWDPPTSPAHITPPRAAGGLPLPPTHASNHMNPSTTALHTKEVDNHVLPLKAHPK